jgi:hypothetical protein
MDFNTTINIIIKDLREAREIIDDFKNYPGVPQIQVELAKSKCKSAEEIIALLKNQDHYKLVEKFEKGKSVKVPEKIEETEKETLIEISEEVIPPSTQDGISTEAEIVTNKQAGQTTGEEEKKVKGRKSETSIVADKFSHMSNIFNEQLGSLKNEEDISAVLKTKPVNDLFEAIGINDKFLYIREIFGGSQESYNEGISKLNKVDNLPDAKAVIMSYTGEGDENEAVKQLLDLIKRKLPADE